MHEYPRLGFVGPMLGVNPGWVTSQGEILANLFAKAGYPVTLTSRRVNRLERLLDTIATMGTWQDSVDVILIMVFSGMGFAVADVASLIGQRLRKPVILWLHGGALPQFSQRFPRWVNRVMRRGCAIVSPSPYLAHHFERMEFPVRVIPNVLDLNDYPFMRRAKCLPRLIWMRTFEDTYNPELAVEVVKRLRFRWPDVVLTMGGQDRGWLGVVKKRIQILGLQSQVHLIGFMDKATKQKEFQRHDIYLSTTRVDNTPVSVVEAAAFGLPIVATSVGGIPYMLQDGETALLVQDDDPEAMASAVERLLIDPLLSTRLSTKGRSMAETYDWKCVRQDWERLFKDLGLF